MADSMAMAMSPYASRYARVAGGASRRTNLTPDQRPMMSASPAAGGFVPTAPVPAPPAGAGPGIIPSAAPSSPYDPMNLDSNIGHFQGALANGVEGYADIAGQDFRKAVGNTLGDLNSIGALRSGATVTSMNDLTTNYARQVGDYAKMASTEGARMGQEEYDANLERKYRADAEKRARKQSLLSGIGTVLGGVGGFMVGGVPGATAGAKIGGAL